MENGLLCQAVVLAAGKSSRFNTEKTKLLFPIAGQELVLYPIRALSEARLPIIVVVGHQKDLIQQTIMTHVPSCSFIYQEERRGTGHAVFTTRSLWHADNILILNGDMPLVTPEILNDLIEQHVMSGAGVTFVISHCTDSSATGYGRVVIENGHIGVMETSEFCGSYDEAPYINAGIYIFKRSVLELLGAELLDCGNQEMYLTSLIRLASEQSLGVATKKVPFDAVRGVNTLKELWIAEYIKRSEIIERWMQEGVQFIAPQTVYIDQHVFIGKNSCIGIGVHLTNGTHIGEHCFIGAFSHINQAIVHDYAVVKEHSIVIGSVVKSHAQVGPFAHVRNQSVIGSYAVVGNFVEISKSVVGEHSKIKHHSYIGNGILGSRVNVGAGTITCNYDGVSKHVTEIQDGAFIGSNNSIVAPVVIGQYAMTAAGSTITDDVPSGALAIARQRQINKEGRVPAMQVARHGQEDSSAAIFHEDT